MKPGLFLRLLWRESRGSRARLSFLTACVAVGVAAVVGVASLTAAVEQGIRLRARDLLGGDLAVEARRPLPDVESHLPRDVDRATLQRISLSIFSTMVRNSAGQSQLAEVKAVDAPRGEYPLSGELLLDPPGTFAERLDDDSVLVAPKLKAQLGLKGGERLRIGSHSFRVAGEVVREPDPLTFSFSFGARVLMTHAGLQKTGLLGFGSRVRYRTLLAFPPDTGSEALDRIKQALVEGLPGGGEHVRIELHSEAQPALRGSVRRVQQYLGLVALLSLLVASVGVAQIVSTWLTQVAPETAILRSLGMRPSEVFLLYLGQVCAISLLGGGVGALIGGAIPAVLANANPEWLPPEVVQVWPGLPAAYGLGLGIGVCLLFSLPPLTSVWRVSPARVLRHEIEPSPAPRSVRVGATSLATLAAFGAALAQSRDMAVAAFFTLGVCTLTSLLWLSTRGLLTLLAWLPRARLPPLLWQGAAALTRPGSGVTGSIVALGLGTMVVLGIALVQDILDRELNAVLPVDAPNVFLMDVQPDQWAGVQALAREHGASHFTSAPVAMARLLSVDGRSVRELLDERPGDPNERNRARWVLTREQRITWAKRLPRDNELVAGTLWSDPQAFEVSLERGFADDMGAKLGSTLRFDVLGMPMDFRVTSLRTVQWRSFSMNFFIVVEPGALDEAPHFVLGGVTLGENAEQGFQDALAARFPNVTMLRVRQLIGRVTGLLAQVAVAVRLLGSFAVLTGLITLIGAVASSQLRRAREVAMLKTLGLTRLQVVGMFALEYALSGAVAGVVGTMGAYTLAHQFAARVLEVSGRPSPSICGVAALLCVALSVISGLTASARALRVSPLSVLRQTS